MAEACSITRRTMFAMSALLTAAPVVAVAAPVPSDAALFARWDALSIECGGQVNQAETEEDLEAWMSRRAAIDARIATTPGRSREAMVAKLRLLHRDRLEDGDPHGVALAAQVLRFLETA